MKPKNPKQTPPLHHIHLELNSETSPELQQVLTFDTVDELLSYDRNETDPPDRVVRRLRVSLPGQEIKGVRPQDPKPWKPRRPD
jgi:hypothetical protein